MIRIDYDDGTQEVSDIPDSDVVIYPWRPPELRVRPRPLSEVQDKATGGGGGGQVTSNSRKHRVKSEARLAYSPRRKVPKGRDRSAGGRREHSRAPRGGGNGRGAPKAGSSPSSSDEASEDGDDGAAPWTGGAGDGDPSIPGSRKNGRFQQKSVKALRGRRSPQRQGQGQGQQRKRRVEGHGRSGSAPKRQRVRNGESWLDGGGCHLRRVARGPRARGALGMCLDARMRRRNGSGLRPCWVCSIVARFVVRSWPDPSGHHWLVERRWILTCVSCVWFR